MDDAVETPIPQEPAVARRGVNGYGVAVAATAAAVLVRRLLDPWLGNYLPFSTLYGAVAVAVWYAGYRPALAAVALGFLACSYLFVDPRGSAWPHGAAQWVGLAAYLFSCGIIVGFGEALRVATRRSETQRRQAEREAADRRAAEEATREVGRQLRVVADNAPVLIAHCDAAARYKFVNAAYAARFGLTPAEVIGRRIPEVVGERAYAAFEPRVREALAGNPVEFEVEIPYDRCGPQVMRCAYTPERDDAGTVVGLVAAIVNVTDRKRSEEALRQSEERYRAFVANSAEGVYRLEFDPPIDTGLPADEQIDLVYRAGRLAECNDAFARMYGFARAAEVIGSGVARMLPPDDPASREFLRAVIANGYRLADAESAERDRDGRPVYIANSLSGVVAGGRLVRVWGTQRDMTARRQAEEQLRRGHETILGLIQNAPFGLYLVDAGFRLAQVSAGSRKVFRNVRPLIGRDFAEVLRAVWPEPFAGEAIARFRRTLETGEPYHSPDTTERRGDTPDTESYDWRIERVTLPDGQFGVVCYFYDLTERKAAAAAAARRSEQARRKAEILPRISAATDIRSVMGVLAGEARALIGAHLAVATYVAGDDWAGAVSVTARSDEYAAWRTFDAQPDGTGIYALVCRTNRPMRLTRAELEAHPAFKGFGRHAPDHPPPRGWLAAPLTGRDGRTLGVLQLADKIDGEFTADDEAVLAQLAHMAAVAVENARLVDDLKQADRRKDEFLATLAHELRNPLAPIRTGLQVIARADGDRAAVDKSVAMMERQMGHLVRLVDDLLDVSRITRGKLELRRERVELSAVIDAAVETARPVIEQGGHDLAVTLPAGPVFVDGDATRLSQVVSNLLNNAAKYTPRGGHVRVNLECGIRNAELKTENRATDTGLHCEIRNPKSEFVQISVADDGVGIPPAMLGTVFDLFTQVDRTLEKTTGGLGIGLSLVKGLVEMHGGTVEARSAGEGRGSEFVVRLPVAPAAVGTPAEPAGRNGAAGPPGRRRVLVVDDNVDAADSTGQLLELLGHEVRTAHDGEAGVAAAGAFRPDVVLMDLGMPRLNGYDAARRIREQPWGKGVVLVALTGWGQEDDRQKSTAAGFDFHLVKPVDPAALLELLTRTAAPAT